MNVRNKLRFIFHMQLVMWYDIFSIWTNSQNVFHLLVILFWITFFMPNLYNLRHNGASAQNMSTQTQAIFPCFCFRYIMFYIKKNPMAEEGGVGFAPTSKRRWYIVVCPFAVNRPKNMPRTTTCCSIIFVEYTYLLFTRTMHVLFFRVQQEMIPPQILDRQPPAWATSYIRVHTYT